MFDSLIEGNYVHHTNGPTVEQGDGIEIKEGSYNNIIRDNVIHDTNYPCILTYSTVGNGAPNVIERNVMWNCGDHGIQSAADAIIRNNIILGSNADGIAMQPHQAGSRATLTVVHNTVLHPTNDAISVSGVGGLGGDRQQRALRAEWQRDPGRRIARLGGRARQRRHRRSRGATGGFTHGSLAADFVAANFSGQPPNDVFPKAGSKLIGAGDVAHVVEWTTSTEPRAAASPTSARTSSMRTAIRVGRSVPDPRVRLGPEAPAGLAAPALAARARAAVVPAAAALVVAVQRGRVEPPDRLVVFPARGRQRAVARPDQPTPRRAAATRRMRLSPGSASERCFSVRGSGPRRARRTATAASDSVNERYGT